MAGPVIIVGRCGRVLLGVAAAMLAVGGLGAQDAEPAPSAETRPADERLARYRVVKTRARAWIDGLEVDPVDLIAHGVKGKKKLAEILEAYSYFNDATGDPAERAAIRQRVEELCRHTSRPGYHNLAIAPPKEFIENSMSYFRVLVLMERFGLETDHYKRELQAIKARMDGHLVIRGQWQRAMFKVYYERFGLELPPILQNLADQEGVLAKRLAANKISLTDAYRLTHQVFVAFDYGRKKTQQHLTEDDVAYLHEVLPDLANRALRGDPDILSEFVSCMTYLGMHDDPAHGRALDYLLTHQNPTGTWGSYEHDRARMGDYVDQHLYLHTTMVAMRALIEVFESDWTPTAGRAPG
jgi:hypothetical protein